MSLDGACNDGLLYLGLCSVRVCKCSLGQRFHLVGIEGLCCPDPRGTGTSSSRPTSIRTSWTTRSTMAQPFGVGRGVSPGRRDMLIQSNDSAPDAQRADSGRATTAHVHPSEDDLTYPIGRAIVSGSGRASACARSNVQEDDGAGRRAQ